MNFEQLLATDEDKLMEMSRMATEILRDYYDPLVGKTQNDYMLEKFQSIESIRDQLDRGYHYYFACQDGKPVGFFAFYPKGSCLYLSKIYLYKTERRKGYFGKILDFIILKAREVNLPAIELNVNKYNNLAIAAYEKQGFKNIRSEKNDIGGGFYMDDYVYRLEIKSDEAKLSY